MDRTHFRYSLTLLISLPLLHSFPLSHTPLLYSPSSLFMLPPHHHLHITSNHNQPPPRKLDHWKVNNEPFELDSRYTVMEFLGSGAYGVVCSAVDTTSISSYVYPLAPPPGSSAPSSSAPSCSSSSARYQYRQAASSASSSIPCCTSSSPSPSPPLPEVRRDYIAIKKCKNIFESRTMAKRTLREIRLVRCLSHPHIISLLSVEPLTSPQQFTSLYTVYELLETDLHAVIKSPQKLTTEHIQLFMYQLLSGLSYLHNVGIIHRDLKPKNILVNKDCLLKIADFGLAKVYSKETAQTSSLPSMTQYITTRWYRAPEVLACWSSYDFGIDVWAVGAIMAELHVSHPSRTRSPLFPGRDSRHQLDLIMTYTGKPPSAFVALCQKSSMRLYLQTLSPSPCIINKTLFPTASSSALSLMNRSDHPLPHFVTLTRLLTVNPLDRISAEEARQHVYLKAYSHDQLAYSSEDLRQTRLLLSYNFSSIEQREATPEQRLSIEEWRAEIIREVGHYHFTQPQPSCSAENSARESNSCSHSLLPEELMMMSASALPTTDPHAPLSTAPPHPVPAAAPSRRHSHRHHPPPPEKRKRFQETAQQDSSVSRIAGLKRPQETCAIS